MDAIILAGGKGTRLQSVVSDVPKPMAPIGGRPFLDYLLTWLERSKIVSRVILSVGYKSDVIQNRYGARFKNIAIEYSVEDEPLGTGGAIKKALRLCRDKNAFVINGDTFFDADLTKLRDRHDKDPADITIAVKEMYDFDRYGTVTIDGNNGDGGAVLSFNEKKQTERGYINGGVYIVNTNVFDGTDRPDKFSFENDVLHKMILTTRAIPFDRDFIDIGIPADYETAQKLIPKWVAI